MKPTTYSFVFLLLMTTAASPAQGVFDRMKQSAKDKANQRVDDSTNSTIDKSVNSVEGSAAAASPKSSTVAQPAQADYSNASPVEDAPVAATVKAYQNYDFTPGDTILFADDFVATADGEFPDQWELVKGQAVVNKQRGYPSLLLTDGNYAQVSPRVKTKNYLGQQFTVEYDTFFVSDSYPLQVFFQHEADQDAMISIGPSTADYSSSEVNLGSELPATLGGDNYPNHWHHVALAVKGQQMKVYVDQYRVLVVPDMHFTPAMLVMGGLASQQAPLVFRNVRIASGGGMNIIGQKFTDAKIVTHGINFDVDKATLRPESMGTLNQIKRIMTDSPDLQFEIDGHTDNTGVAAHNLTLSQQRAEAVKAQLVTRGISASRLTAKGFGDSKPTADNTTSEGKANNRRVEFVKIS